MDNRKPIHTIYHPVTVNEKKLAGYLRNETFSIKQALEETLRSGGRPSLPPADSSAELNLLNQIVRESTPQVSRAGLFGSDAGRGQKQKAVSDNEQKQPKELPKPKEPGKS